MCLFCRRLHVLPHHYRPSFLIINGYVRNQYSLLVCHPSCSHIDIWRYVSLNHSMISFQPVTQEKKFSTGLVTQRNPRPPSPVKEAPLKPPVKEEPRPVKAAPLPEPVKETSASLPTKEEPPPTKKTPSPEPVKEEPLKPQVKEEPVPVKSAPVPQPVKVKVEPPARKVQEEKSKPPVSLTTYWSKRAKLLCLGAINSCHSFTGSR